MSAFTFQVTVRDDGAHPDELKMAVNGLANLLRTVGAAGDLPEGCSFTVTDPIATRLNLEVPE